MARDPKSDVLQLALSRFHGLDIVRLPKQRKYRIVLAERFGVQKRAFVEVTFEEAHRLALFLASIDDHIGEAPSNEPPTDPGRPSRMPPQDLQPAEDEDSRNLLELPVIPAIPRTRSRNVPPDPNSPEREFDDPRTGAIPTAYPEQPTTKGNKDEE